MIPKIECQIHKTHLGDLCLFLALLLGSLLPLCRTGVCLLIIIILKLVNLVGSILPLLIDLLLLRIPLCRILSYFVTVLQITRGSTVVGRQEIGNFFGRKVFQIANMEP